MKQKGILAAFAVVAVAGVIAAAGLAGKARAEDAKAAAGNVYELRTYKAAPGKLQALHTRFREHTNQIFLKHGMTPIAYWTPADGPDAEDTLIYILAHKSREAAKKSWMEFGADPEWKKARAESEVDGSLTVKVESKFLNPTDYSPMK